MEGDVREQFLVALTERVQYMIDNDYKKLLTALYLLDIAEARFRKAMALPKIEYAARALAELILDREIEKMRSREKYSNPSPDVPRVDVDEA